jgi:uncharacterized paraquat-inducible protein A
MGLWDQLLAQLDKLGLNFSFFVTLLGGFLLLIVVLVLCAGIIIFFARKKQYNIKIIVLENVRGNWQETMYDKATEVFLREKGITVLRLRQLKTPYGNYLPRPSIASGVKQYTFAIGKDGEWLNVGVEDVDEKRKQLKLKFDSVDLRNQRAAFDKMLHDTYKKAKWWEPYIPYIALAVFMLFLGLAFFFIADKQVEGLKISGQNLQIANELTDKQNELIARMDSACIGSGFVPEG